MRMAGGRELPACMATKVRGVAAGQAETWVGEYGWACWGRERGMCMGLPRMRRMQWRGGHRERVSRACAPWQKAQACSKSRKPLSVTQSACKALDACQSLCLAHEWVTPAQACVCIWQSSLVFGD
jgi:hypothetical protein